MVPDIANKPISFGHGQIPTDDVGCVVTENRTLFTNSQLRGRVSVLVVTTPGG